MNPTPFPEERVEAERLLLAALCQGSLGEDAGNGVRRRLAGTQFAAPEHEIVFRALANMPDTKPEQIRETLAGAATRLGFPDLDLEPLFRTAPAAERDIPALFGRLEPNGSAPETAPRHDTPRSSRAAGRKWLLAAPDVVGIPLGIAWILWHRPNEVVVPVLLATWTIVSILLHRDTLGALGLRVDNLAPATRQAATVSCGLGIGLLLMGVILRGLALRGFQPLADVFTAPRVWRYFPGVIVQEFVLNGLLLNRLLALFSRRWMALLTAAVIFSALHWPNPVLVPLTLAAGLIVTWLFARERNLIPLIVAHTVLGLLLWWAFPLSWHHALRVGPAYYNFRIETYHTN